MMCIRSTCAYSVTVCPSSIILLLYHPSLYLMCSQSQCTAILLRPNRRSSRRTTRMTMGRQRHRNGTERIRVFILMVGMHVPKRIITFNSIFCSINGRTKNNLHRRLGSGCLSKPSKQRNKAQQRRQRQTPIDRSIGDRRRTNVVYVHKTFNCSAINDLLSFAIRYITPLQRSPPDLGPEDAIVSAYADTSCYNDR